MVRNFKEEFTRLNSTGESGSEVDLVYEKMEELLRRYPTILPPHTYSSHSRQFTANLPSEQHSLPTSSQVPVVEHERPAVSPESEPPFFRRRMKTPPLARISSSPPPIVSSSTARRPNNPAASARRPQAFSLSNAESMLNRIVDREHELRRGQFRKFREYMERRSSRSDSTADAMIASLDRATAAIEQNGARMRELYDLFRQQRPHQ